MKKLSCIKAGSLIGARAAGLSSAEGLWLEEHTGDCEDCHYEASMMSGVRAVARSFEPELTVQQRSAVMHRALHAHAYGAATPRQSRVVPALWGFALASAAAMVIGFFALRAPQQAMTIAEQSVAEHRAVPGLEREPQPAIAQSDAAILQSGARLHARSRTQVTLGHASVELAPDSDAQWNAQTHELELFAGEVLAEVDPKPRQPFAIVTQAFRAEVLGTRFEVTQSSVHVLRGRVRVVTADGIERAVLNVGERYDHLDDARSESEPVKRSARSKREPHDRSSLDLYASLDEARDAVAAAEFDRARTAIDRVLDAKPGVTARAEALTLRADLLAAQGQRLAARKAYLAVAKRFADLPAGENALFAAARMASDESSERALLTKYLDRYPHGRFVAEASKRLARVSK